MLEANGTAMSWDWWTPRAAQRTPGQDLALEVFNLLMVVAVFVVGALFLGRRIFLPHEGPLPHLLGSTTMNEPGFAERCGPPSADPYVVTWIHSPDLSAWIEPASTEFMRSCPNTQVRLHALDDLRAAQAIVSGELEPTVWSPSDRSMLDVLDARWERDLERAATPLALTQEASLVSTPLVLLIWRDRHQVLDRALPASVRDYGGLAASSCAGITDELAALASAASEDAVHPSPDWVPTGWDQLWLAAYPSPTQLPASPPLAELERWGRVRVGHASPTSSPLGLLSLYLLGREHLDGGGMLDADELGVTMQTRREQLLAWLRRCEGGLDAPLPSALLLTETMFNLGDPARDPRGFDAVFTNEQLAFAVLTRVSEHESALRPIDLVYPRSSLMLDYPAAMLGAPRPLIRDAALRFMNFLREPQQQARALELGFRPAIDDPRVSLREYDAGPNPFISLRRHGVELEPELVEAPRVEGDVLLDLVDTWRVATGR